MLLRGQNLLGYRHYSDEVVEKFVAKSIENGVKVVRVFDALNDPRNLETSMKAIKKYGGVCEAASSVIRPVPFIRRNTLSRSLNSWKAWGRIISASKIWRTCCCRIQLSTSFPNLKKELKPETKVHLHTHNTAGTGDMVNLKAIEAGADIVDTALSPLGNGTSQPATEPLVATLAGTPYDTGIDIRKLLPVVRAFQGRCGTSQKRRIPLAEGALHRHQRAYLSGPGGGCFPTSFRSLNSRINLINSGKSSLKCRMFAKTAGIRRLSRPPSQIVGTQAVLNVLAGERYKMVTKGIQGASARRIRQITGRTGCFRCEKVHRG